MADTSGPFSSGAQLIMSIVELAYPDLVTKAWQVSFCIDIAELTVRTD